MSIIRYEFGGLVFSVTYDFARLERNFCKVAGLYQGQPRILTILKENEGVTLSALSQLCSIGMPSLSVSVRNLQKSGLLRKEGSGKNQKLYLTDTGRSRALIFHQQIDAFYASLLDSLGPEKSQALNDSFTAFDQYIKDFNKRFEEEQGWNKK